MFYQYKNCIFCIQNVGFPTRQDGSIFFLLKIKVKTTNIVTFSFIYPFKNFYHDVFFVCFFFFCLFFFSLLNESAACVSFKKCASHINVGPT